MGQNPVYQVLVENADFLAPSTPATLPLEFLANPKPGF